MDVRNGRIYTAEEVAIMSDEDRQHMRPMAIEPTGTQLARGSVGRNDPCPCGSGKKFKKCCLFARDAEVRAAARQRALEETA